MLRDEDVAHAQRVIQTMGDGGYLPTEVSLAASQGQLRATLGSQLERALDLIDDVEGVRVRHRGPGGYDALSALDMKERKEKAITF